MPGESFPVVYSRDVAAARAFYAGVLGFDLIYSFPPDADSPGYVGLVRGGSRLGLVDAAFPAENIGARMGDGPRFELFVYVDDVDAAFAAARAAGAPALREPADMPWGERVAFVADPDGNPITLAAPLRSPQ